MERTKPILRWPGGKTRLLSDILPLIRPHRLYVEAFAGGLAVLLAKPPSPAEIVNDLNGDLVNLYRHAQYHLDALIREVEFTLTSRAELTGLIEQPGLTGLQQAARYLLRNRISFGGGGTSFAVSKTGQPSREGVLELLRRFNRRMDKVSVENLPFERLFTNYDSPETYWFLDPPYSVGKIDAYDAWTDARMSEFAARVHDLKGDYIVTVNDCPHNRALFAQDEVTPLVTRSGAVNRRLRPQAAFGELLIRRRIKAARATKAQKTARFRAVVPALRLAA